MHCPWLILPCIYAVRMAARRHEKLTELKGAAVASLWRGLFWVRREVISGYLCADDRTLRADRAGLTGRVLLLHPDSGLDEAGIIYATAYRATRIGG